MAASALPAGFGINFYAQFSSNTGLGVTARNTARALAEAGVPLRCIDREPHFEAARDNAALNDLPFGVTRDAGGAFHPVSLYNVSAFDANQPGTLARGALHVPIVWWESTALHPSWSAALMKYDLVVAYSEFTTQVLANSLHLTPALGGKQPLFLPSGVEPGRRRFGLPEDSTVFLAAFDPSSDPERKNPGAVVAAFRHAFPRGDENVRLIFRLNKPDGTPLAQAGTRWLIEHAGGDSRIGFALQPMSYSEVLSLYASADVHVSLHRAEGLGLGMLESMRLGIPVIATGWSGNMGFMDHRCAALVRYRLIPTNGNQGFLRADFLGPGAFWADPLVEDAVAWMRMLHDSPDARRRLAGAGLHRAESYQREALELRWVHDLAHFWQNRTRFPSVREKYSAWNLSQ